MLDPTHNMTSARRWTLIPKCPIHRSGGRIARMMEGDEPGRPCTWVLKVPNGFMNPGVYMQCQALWLVGHIPLGEFLFWFCHAARRVACLAFVLCKGRAALCLVAFPARRCLVTPSEHDVDEQTHICTYLPLSVVDSSSSCLVWRAQDSMSCGT